MFAVVGAEVTGLLNEMVKSAGGRPVVLVNPSLADRPSSNNVMQIRGRQERREVMDSFKDIFVLRLLYPSSGGYMYPIRGLVVKQSYYAPYVAYAKTSISDSNATEEDDDGSGTKKKARAEREFYKPIGAFAAHPKPDADALSNLFLTSDF